MDSIFTHELESSFQNIVGQQIQQVGRPFTCDATSASLAGKTRDQNNWLLWSCFTLYRLGSVVVGERYIPHSEAGIRGQELFPDSP